MSLKRLWLGKTGEDLATAYLCKSRYSIIVRNYRTRYGEIDIIAEKNTIIIFVEVKTRKSSFLESPFSAVTIKKQKQISKVAQEYLAKNNLFDRDARFDVIAVTSHEPQKPQIEHLKNAFELSYGF